MAIQSDQELRNTLIIANGIELGTNILQNLSCSGLARSLYDTNINHALSSALIAESIVNELSHKE